MDQLIDDITYWWGVGVIRCWWLFTSYDEQRRAIDGTRMIQPMMQCYDELMSKGSYRSNDWWWVNG